MAEAEGEWEDLLGSGAILKKVWSAAGPRGSRPACFRAETKCFCGFSQVERPGAGEPCGRNNNATVRYTLELDGRVVEDSRELCFRTGEGDAPTGEPGCRLADHAVCVCVRW
jgi:hypothetical protein